ncbi:MAG TPA: ORF6N domain-containing protein [Chthoniobacterales bacterium]|nr:ORF6N domain-containing protein [Chthoniobacterales bacterium]
MISLRNFEPDMTRPQEIVAVENAIHLVRGQRVMLDSDLAAFYGVTTKRLNEQLKRNRQRFPKDFAFQLTTEELVSLRSQFATSKQGGRRYRPWVFTEHGAIMLASVLNSDIAVEASVRVVRAFVRLREMISANTELAAKFSQLERRLDSHDEAIAQLFAAIRQLLAPSQKQRREIGFHVRERRARYGAKGRA